MAQRDNEQPLRVDHLQSDLVGRSVRGGAVTVGAQALKVVIQFGTILILSRLLPPYAFGLLAMVAALTEILDQIKDFGLSMATIQKPDVTHEQVTALFWINSGIGATAATALWTAAPLVAQFYGHAELTEITRWLALGFLISGLATQHWALLRRQMRFSTIAAIDLGCEVLAMATAVVAAAHGAGLWALVAQRLTYGAAVMLASWSTAGWRPGLPRRCAGVGSLLTYGASVTGNGIVNVVARTLDQVLIGWFWGPQPLGLYERAYKLLMGPINQVTIPLYSVGMPALSRMASDPDRYRRTYIALSERLAMLTVPPAALLMVTADWVVAVMLGSQWGEAAPILAWLGLAASLMPVATITGLLFLTQDRAGDLFKVGLLGAAISIAAILAGLPFGTVGVAAGFALGMTCLRIPMCFWLAGRKGPVGTGDLYRSLLPSVAAAAAVFLVATLLRTLPTLQAASPILGLAITGAASIATMLLCFSLIPRSRSALLGLLHLPRLALGARKARA
ncbi:lipopolysaccharide biosynthesis protein [Vineibacter terrae]|uniref:lipopolysaccharide biosynthesis protein n=1 Tax=Vineibacter terrae TaxID=2586908 RepID=UPI0015B6A063|nr:lipopolysaccharide biosynthesis protein [Vineibacter terrae]